MEGPDHDAIPLFVDACCTSSASGTLCNQGRRTSTACFVITCRLLYGGSALAILGCLLVIMAVLISEKGGDYR